jgi:hypothetical protein
MTIKLSKKETQYFYVENSKIHGKGLFASTAIEAGTYLGDYEGPETSVMVCMFYGQKMNKVNGLVVMVKMPYVI